jgi:hypothetical protein
VQATGARLGLGPHAGMEARPGSAPRDGSNRAAAECKRHAGSHVDRQDSWRWSRGLLDREEHDAAGGRNRIGSAIGTHVARVARFTQDPIVAPRRQDTARVPPRRAIGQREETFQDGSQEEVGIDSPQGGEEAGPEAVDRRGEVEAPDEAEEIAERCRGSIAGERNAGSRLARTRRPIESVASKSPDTTSPMEQECDETVSRSICVRYFLDRGRPAAQAVLRVTLRSQSRPGRFAGVTGRGARFRRRLGPKVIAALSH